MRVCVEVMGYGEVKGCSGVRGCSEVKGVWRGRAHAAVAVHERQLARASAAQVDEREVCRVPGRELWHGV